MGNTRRSKGKKLLSNSRPGMLKPGSRELVNLPSRATRRMIRSHHNLHKKLRQAESQGDEALKVSLKGQIEANGGLKKYQLASLKGQSAERGGDSSKILMDWLQEAGVEIPLHGNTGLKMLEVGALTVDNACAKSGLFEMTRIDLNSQHKEILEQDFMQRLPPSASSMKREGFDIISLSLVLNYVPHPEGRGDMLLHTTRFLRDGVDNRPLFPGLFLVLPAPCTQNSRYMTNDHLESMLKAIGYCLLNSKATSKLVYFYFSYRAKSPGQRAVFPKKQLRDRRNMNNFSIVLR